MSKAVILDFASWEDYPQVRELFLQDSEFDVLAQCVTGKALPGTAQGASKPLFGEEPYQDTAGDVPNHAVEKMRDALLGAAQKVHLVCMGPLSNVAVLFASAPQVKEHIEMVHIFGGNMMMGNATMGAEKMMYADPEAGRMVFDFGVPIKLYTMDVATPNDAYLALKDEHSFDFRESFVQIEVAGSTNRGRSVIDMRDTWAKAERQGKPVTWLALQKNCL